MYASQGLVQRLGHDDALASGQAVGLDDDGSTLAAHVLGAGLLVGEAAVGGGGNAGAAHDLLGKLLGALHLGGVAVGAKARDARRTHGVGNACHQRRLRTDDHEADLMGAGPLGNSHRVLGVKALDLLGHGVHAAVARGNVEAPSAGRLGELGEKRVLAPAGAQEQDVDLVHKYLLLGGRLSAG